MKKLNIDALTGSSDKDPFAVFDGRFCNKAQILDDALMKKDLSLKESVFMSDFFSAFWAGDFTSAYKSALEFDFTSSKVAKSFKALHYIFYVGIVAFRLFREGSGEQFLTKGDEVLRKMKLWLQAW